MAMDDVTCIFEGKQEAEWIWVTGYKGTDRGMKCKDYQYELKKAYSIPDDEEVVECSNGFHLCKELCHVFGYYSIGNGNRFFEVSARVRKRDLECYGNYRRNKLVAKDIVFVRELNADEILQAYLEDRYGQFPPEHRAPETKLENWTDARKAFALDYGAEETMALIATDELVRLGYSLPFANYIMCNEAYHVARVVASLEELSMDMRAMYIFNEIQRQALRRGSEPYSYRSRKR